jgi:ADP-ribosyl-[dinitrogen reductase] hydrolase
MDVGIVARAQGCLLEQLAGDALGSQVEFASPDKIARAFPDGVRELRNGGTWGTIAGQPTGDSEMALLLARMLVRTKRYDAAEALNSYVFWLNSGPFDVGNTIRAALHGRPSTSSQANGAMMRVSPLGIFGATLRLDEVARMARADAALTHPNPVCLDANALFTMAIATAIRNQTTPKALYTNIASWAFEMEVSDELRRCIDCSQRQHPQNFVEQQGWVLIAFGNALYRLLHAVSLEEALVETVMCGGDTDTNAAIAGALLGAVHGREAVPERWTQCLLNCRRVTGRPDVERPRPEVFWPIDSLELARMLLLAGASENPRVIHEEPRNTK